MWQYYIEIKCIKLKLREELKSQESVTDRQTDQVDHNIPDFRRKCRDNYTKQFQQQAKFENKHILLKRGYGV